MLGGGATEASLNPVGAVSVSSAEAAGGSADGTVSTAALRALDDPPVISAADGLVLHVER